MLTKMHGSVSSQFQREMIRPPRVAFIYWKCVVLEKGWTWNRMFCRPHSWCETHTHPCGEKRWGPSCDEAGGHQTLAFVVLAVSTWTTQTLGHLSDGITRVRGGPPAMLLSAEVTKFNQQRRSKPGLWRHTRCIAKAWIQSLQYRCLC